MNQQTIERALADGELWARMSSGRYWRLRRNGATKTWKTRGGEFRIPVKCGLKTCGAITHSDRVVTAGDADWRSANFVISFEEPNNV
jgi:hypothetical protein